MRSIRFVIYTYLCVTITSKTRGISAPAEDLVDEYYTTILKPNNDTIPQDEKDAQAIMDSDRREDVIAGILPYRDKIRRFAIQQRMLTKIDPIRKYSSGRSQTNTIYYWVSEKYDPQRNYNTTYTFMDLCFGLLLDENVVFGQYLNNFFNDKDETMITIGMVLTKDMGAMIETYNRVPRGHYVTFKDKRKSQKKPYENMLRAWVRHNRDAIEQEEPNHDDVVNDANALKKEHDSGDWHEKKRDKLEQILMYKSIKYARAVIAEFETIMGNKTIESIIIDSKKTCDLNHDLADAYSSLAMYIKDKYNYIADTLSKHSEGSDYWAVWVICIAVLRPQEWPKVDFAFRNLKDHKNDSLSKFIIKKLTADKVMAEMIAVLVDPKFKPTTFTGNPA